MLLLFDELVRHLHEHTGLQLAILGVTSVEIVGFVCVGGLHLCNYVIAFLHDPPHVELILLILLALLCDVRRIQVQVAV